jgi:putrescine transport system permease protein
MKTLSEIFDKSHWSRRLIVSVPFLWFIAFLLLPFFFVLRISFSMPANTIPPFTPLLVYSDQTLQIILKVGNYLYMFEHDLFFISILNSIQISVSTTILCILIGYPMAYAMAKSSPSVRTLLLMLIIIPYWTSFLLRAYAWVTILQNHGLVNSFLTWIGLDRLPLIYNNFSMHVGLLYGYLPFFILPLYATLIKLDFTLDEAAADLGAKPIKTFFWVILPQSLPGLIAGSLLVFIPVIGEVVIPQILGGLNNVMIGNVIWEEFFTANNWGIASALATILLILLITPIVILQKIQHKQDARRLAIQ